MENQEFKIDSRSEQFRVSKITPVEMLAISTQVNLENFEQTKVLYQFALEHTEVLLGDGENAKWKPVKTPKSEVYVPFGIDKDMKALNDLCLYFVTEVIYKAFQKSSESV